MRSARSFIVMVVVLVSVFGLVACGQMGPLKLPAARHPSHKTPMHH